MKRVISLLICAILTAVLPLTAYAGASDAAGVCNFRSGEFQGADGTELFEEYLEEEIVPLYGQADMTDKSVRLHADYYDKTITENEREQVRNFPWRDGVIGSTIFTDDNGDAQSMLVYIAVEKGQAIRAEYYNKNSSGGIKPAGSGIIATKDEELFTGHLTGYIYTLVQLMYYEGRRCLVTEELQIPFHVADTSFRCYRVCEWDSSDEFSVKYAVTTDGWSNITLRSYSSSGTLHKQTLWSFVDDDYNIFDEQMKNAFVTMNLPYPTHSISEVTNQLGDDNEISLPSFYGLSFAHEVFASLVSYDYSSVEYDDDYNETAIFNATTQFYPDDWQSTVSSSVSPVGTTSNVTSSTSSYSSGTVIQKPRSSGRAAIVVVIVIVMLAGVGAFIFINRRNIPIFGRFTGHTSHTGNAGEYSGSMPSAPPQSAPTPPTPPTSPAAEAAPVPTVSLEKKSDSKPSEGKPTVVVKLTKEETEPPEGETELTEDQRRAIEEKLLGAVRQLHSSDNERRRIKININKMIISKM